MAINKYTTYLIAGVDFAISVAIGTWLDHLLNLKIWKDPQVQNNRFISEICSHYFPYPALFLLPIAD
jgi:hypothetical protein